MTGHAYGIPKDLQIGHLLESTDVEGNPVSFQWDKIDGEDWIVVKDAAGKVIFKCQKILWEDKIAGFTAEMRDQILESCRKLYG